MYASIVKFDLKTKLNVYKFHSNEQNINIFRKKWIIGKFSLSFLYYLKYVLRIFLSWTINLLLGPSIGLRVRVLTNFRFSLHTQSLLYTCTLAFKIQICWRIFLKTSIPFCEYLFNKLEFFSNQNALYQGRLNLRKLIWGFFLRK